MPAGSEVDGSMPPAVYVFVGRAPDGWVAKVGFCEKASNVEKRRRTVEAKRGISLTVAVAVVLAGQVLDEHDTAYDEKWAEVEHLESALRLVLARRLGRLHAWPEWIHIDDPAGIDWSSVTSDAWAEVAKLGRTGQKGLHSLPQVPLPTMAPGCGRWP